MAGTIDTTDRAIDGLLRLAARRLFERSGLFEALPLTGRVPEVGADYGHLAEAAVHHIPNRNCVIVDAGRARRDGVNRRVHRDKFDRVCAAQDRLPFAEASFDAAWTTVALARLEPEAHMATLVEMIRIVPPGGTLVTLERVADTPWRTLQARFDDALTLAAPFGFRCYRSIASPERLVD